MSSRVDLHVHTSASDGQLSPTEIVHKALEIGLAAIAITDHDTTGGIAEALEAARGTSLEVIPGVEISTDISQSEIHILGYYVAYRDPSLCSKLVLFRDSRLVRAQRMVAKLIRMGLPLGDALEGAHGKAAGLFPVDLARPLLRATSSDWELVRWIDAPPADQFLEDLRRLGEELLLLQT